MVKKQNKKKGKGKRRQSQPRLSTAPPTKITYVTRKSKLDGPARAYLRLLRDPCSAPLCDPVLPGTDRGMYWRSRSQLSLPSKFASDTATCFVAYFVPYVGTWYISANASAATISTWDPSVKLAEPVPAAIDTWYFISNSAPSSFQLRAIAGCTDLVYVSKNTDCSGTISIHNNVPHKRVAVAGVTYDSLAASTGYVTRTPVDSGLQTLWAPTEADDTRWVEPSHYPGHSDIDASGILIVGRNLVATTRLNLLAYTVTEYLPALSGTVIPAGVETSTSTWQEVMAAFLTQPAVLSLVSAAAMGSFGF